MPQGRDTGAKAVEYGLLTAKKVADALGGLKVGDPRSNEYEIHNKRVVIKCARSSTSSVGVTHQMLDRMSAVLACFEVEDNVYDIYEMTPVEYRRHMIPTRSKGSSAGKVGIVTKSTFLEKSKFLRQVTVGEAKKMSQQNVEATKSQESSVTPPEKVMNVSKLKGFTSSDLLSLYTKILDELRDRKVVRSTNNPVADYAENVVARAMNLSLATKSTTGFDAEDDAGHKYEVKARRLTNHNKSRQLSQIRGLDKNHFDYLAGVLFTEDFKVFKACLIPISVVKDLAVYKEHVNAWILHLRDSVWKEKGVVDITDAVRVAEIEAGH